MVMWKFNIKLITAVAYLFLAIPGCNPVDSPSVNDAELIAGIDDFISGWHHSAANSDHSKYIGSMAEDGVYIGTDASEHWTTREFSDWSKPYFDRKKGWNLKKLDRHIYVGTDKRIAWFDELLDTGMGICRGSGVLQKNNDQWRICHYVLSPTIPNELISQIKSLKSTQDSLIINTLKSKP